MTAAFPLVLNGVKVRRLGKTVLGPVDLTLSANGTTIIVGPNGSGKTTLLRVMHGIERIRAGGVVWENDDPAKHALSFQTPIMLRRSVAENLAYPLMLLKTPKDQIDMAVDHWLERIGLESSRGLKPRACQGGSGKSLRLPVP